MNPLRLLFETQQMAREIAFMLRCDYDGCNMITLPQKHDPIALRTAIELTGADFCFDGDHYPIVLPFPDIASDAMPVQSTEQSRPKAELWCSGEG